ncbi:MobP2 family relaxase [Virgibacillus ihumii]|uniref:MobP2 family relaxase n=1 Tax=Virgibacillus ihumii TaxID=2686091 RepID=UPI00157D5A3A|nr:MobP2 family relaxase [Virgibacillus ihumii]
MSPAVVLRTKFVTSHSRAFNDYVNYIDRDDAKGHVHVNESSKDKDDFLVFFDFMDYMDDREKQGELFTNRNDKLSLDEKKTLKEQFQLAQKNNSPMWQDVISFDNGWLAKQDIYFPESHTVDEEKMRDMVRKTMNTVLQSEGMEKSAIWTASLHYNTDNIHVHVATVEPHPTRERMNVLDEETGVWHEEYRAKRKPKTLEKMKSNVANMLMDRTNERNRIDELLRGTIQHKKENQVSLATYQKTKELFKEGIKHLPSDKRQWKYGYQSINAARPYIDEITDIYLQQFHADDLEQLHQQLDGEVEVMKEMYGEESNYDRYKQTKLDDLKKRMGNVVLAEMRAYDKEQNNFKSQYKQMNKQTLFQQSWQPDQFDNQAVTSFRVSLIRLQKAMRKTFQDYEKEKNQREFDQMMEGYEM